MKTCKSPLRQFFLQTSDQKYRLVFCLFLLLAACGKSRKNADNKDKTPAETEEDVWVLEEEKADAPLHQTLDMLQDSIRAFRLQAFASEAEKLESTLALLQEIETSFVAPYDTEALAAVRVAHIRASKMCYDSLTLAQESVMLAYDEATEELMGAWGNFVQNSEEFPQHARAKLLWKDIQNADQSDFRIRNTYYNAHAMEYNRLLIEKAHEIRQLGEKYQALKPFPLFYGGPAL